MRRLISLAAVLLLMGCATNPLPDDYVGQTAVVKDSHANYVEASGMKPEHVELFAMTHVDGKFIWNTRNNTVAATQTNSGGRLIIVGAERKVPIRPLKVELVGLIHASGPLFAPSARETQRTVNFTPVAGETYVVRGRLAGAGFEVWLETAGGKRVAE